MKPEHRHPQLDVNQNLYDQVPFAELIETLSQKISPLLETAIQNGNQTFQKMYGDHPTAHEVIRTFLSRLVNHSLNPGKKLQTGLTQHISEAIQRQFIESLGPLYTGALSYLISMIAKDGQFGLNGDLRPEKSGFSRPTFLSWVQTFYTAKDQLQALARLAGLEQETATLDYNTTVNAPPGTTGSGRDWHQLDSGGFTKDGRG